jgi:mRNA interferase MazF
MPAFQITDRIKQDVRNARMIGEFTVKIGAQKLPGMIWNVVSKVQAQQVRTISKQRILGDVVGSLSTELLELVNAALRLHLS